MPTSARAGCTVFTETCSGFVLPSGRQGRRPLQCIFGTWHPVGADASVRPQDAPFFSKPSGESATAQRADVGIGPYTGFKILSVIRYLEKQKKMLDRSL